MSYLIIKTKYQLCWQIILAFLALSMLSACTSRHPIDDKRSIHGDINYTVELWASTNCILPGETVTVRATVTNVGSQTLIIDLRDQVVFDLIITDQNGEHRWSEGKSLMPELTRLELKPGQSKMLEMQWVVQPLTSVVVVTAQFIDNPAVPGGPVRAQVSIPSLCPGY